MERYTVNHKLAQALKENGYPQNTQFYYCSDLGELTYSKNCKPYKRRKCGEHLAMPMAEEIFEQLPTDTELVKQDIIDHQPKYRAVYPDQEKGMWNYPTFLKDSMADPLAELWIYLRNNGYALPNGINQSKPS